MIDGVRLVLALVLSAALHTSVHAQAERVVDVPTREKSKVRALLLIPDHPRGSVILLAGGHGRLDIAPDGRLGWGSGNQLVRTRAMYAQAGYATLVPDIAPDLKEGAGVARHYRWSANHATDIGNLVAYMRDIAQPVHVIGTSRAALSVANAGVRLAGVSAAQRPDSLVITSGMLMHERDRYPSVETTAGQLSAITQPVLLMAHENDTCFVTPPTGPRRLAPLLSRARRVDVILLTGGDAGSGDPCGASSHHGFLGIDDVVVQKTVEWLGRVGRP